MKRIYSKPKRYLGGRDGWGAAWHKNGYSHLLELECGHAFYVKNSRYKGFESPVYCRFCTRKKGDQKNGK